MSQKTHGFMKTKTKSSICFCFILFFTSCTTRASLNYTSIIQEQAKNYVCISVDNFEDTRLKPKQIGALRNGYGMPAVKITTDDDVPMWMKAALEEELINAGYSIIDEESVDTYHIKGKIIKVNSGTYFTYYGNIAVEMVLNQGEKILLKKNYISNKSDGLCYQLSPFMNTAKQAIKCSDALKLNLQGIYRQFIEDINQQLLSRDSAS
jgi:hypothetical protein